MPLANCELSEPPLGAVSWLDGLEPWQGMMGEVRMIACERVLYRDEDASEFIYVIRSGTFKLILGLADGREQICGFRMAGELLGLEGVGSGRYASSAVALENAGICAISHAMLADHFADANLMAAFNRQMSGEMKRDNALIMLLGGMSARGRVAGFLAGHSGRLKTLGYSPTEFHLRMSRADIGSYLGLSLETVSRAFTALQSAKVLKVDKRHVMAIDLKGLQQIFEAG